MSAPAIQTSRHSARHAKRWEEVRNRGSIELDRRPSGDRYRIVFYFKKNRVRIHGRPRPSGGIEPFKTEKKALEALAELRAEAVAREWPIERVVGLWRQNIVSEGDRIEGRVLEYLGHLRGLVASGARSPNTVREVERYAEKAGHWSWWWGRSVHGITYGDVEDWHAWLAKRPRTRHGKPTGQPIHQKTQKNVSDSFRAFLRRLRKRGEIETVPEFPEIKVPDYAPKTITPETLERVLEAIPWEKRGAFLLAAYEALRISEIKPLDLSDWDGESLFVGKAIQGSTLDAPVRHTKNRSAMYREVWNEDLLAWLHWRTGEGRMLAPFAKALAWNPGAQNPDKRWTSDPMENAWNAACAEVGVEISLQEGTRHSMLTALGERVPERVLQKFSRHRDAKSLSHYVKPSAKATSRAAARALKEKE